MIGLTRTEHRCMIISQATKANARVELSDLFASRILSSRVESRVESRVARVARVARVRVESRVAGRDVESSRKSSQYIMSINIDAEDKLELHSISGLVLYPDHNYM